MAKKLDYRHVDREQLASFLGEHTVLAAEATADVRIYRCAGTPDEALVIALSDGSGLIVNSGPRAPVDRRRRAR